ncbi:hypothetical protein GCM10027615_06490 [Plantactinospora veratri]
MVRRPRVSCGAFLEEGRAVDFRLSVVLLLVLIVVALRGDSGLADVVAVLGAYAALYQCVCHVSASSRPASRPNAS